MTAARVGAHELVGSLDALADISFFLSEVVGQLEQERLELKQDGKHTIPAGPSLVKALAA